MNDMNVTIKAISKTGNEESRNRGMGNGER